MKIKVFMLTGLVSFGIILILLKISIPTLTITSNGSIEEFYSYTGNAEFSIRWQHSVEKEDWEEMFVVQGKDSMIKLVRTRFKTFGAGVPNDVGEDSYIKDGWVYMTGIKRVIGDQLFIRTGEETNHRFYFEKEASITFDKEQSYLIEVNRLSLLGVIRSYISAKMR